MRTNLVSMITVFREVAYADIPSTKARLLAKGYKVDEICVSKNYYNYNYTVTATHIE